MVDSSAISGSGQVLNSSIFNNINTSSIANSLVNFLNSFAPKGYFILQQQFGISPFLAFILVGLAIMTLYYLAAYIFFTKLFNDQTLFENIKRPLLVFVFSLGFLSAYAVGYLVYIFEIVLIALVVSLFILIIIAIFTGGLGGYRAGGFVVHKIAKKFYEAAGERYRAQIEAYKAKEQLKNKDWVINHLKSAEENINRIENEFNDSIKVLNELPGLVRNIENRIQRGIRAKLNAIRETISQSNVKPANAPELLKKAGNSYKSMYNSLKTLENLPQNLDSRQLFRLVTNVLRLISNFEDDINELVNVYKNSTVVSDDIKNKIISNGNTIENYIRNIKGELEDNLLRSIQKADINYFVNMLKEVVNNTNNVIMYAKAHFHFEEEDKREINKQIGKLNEKIGELKSKLARHGANINGIGNIITI